MKKVLPLVVAASLLLSTATSFAATNSDATSKFLEKKFNISDAAKEFKTINTQVDELGMKHERVQQMVDGIPVYGAQYSVHYDANGNIYASKGQYDVKAKNVKATAKLTAKDAINAAKAAINYTAVKPTRQLKADQFNADLYLYDVNGEFTPCYVVKASWLHEDTFGNYVVSVNAVTGEVVDQYDNTQYTATTGTGIGILGDTKAINLDYRGSAYYLTDLTRGAYIETYTANNGTTNLYYMTDTDTTWNSSTQKAGVDAHYYAGKVYDYYKNVHGRNGIDNNNMKMLNVVHYSTNYVNAFWDGTYMVFGDGDGVNSTCLAGGIDVIAHEYSHGVTEHNSAGGLQYSYESGALNESFSDVMAVAIEKYVQPTRWDWLIGEDIWTPGIPGDALRDLSNPTAYGDPDNYANRYIGTADNGGVHTNSLIPSHAAYAMYLNGLTVEQIARVFYRANMYYYDYTETMYQARLDTIQAATDLNYNTTAVAAGWTHVGIN